MLLFPANAAEEPANSLADTSQPTPVAAFEEIMDTDNLQAA
jgi:hypothetical protein